MHRCIEDEMRFGKSIKMQSNNYSIKSSGGAETLLTYEWMIHWNRYSVYLLFFVYNFVKVSFCE